jgi:hypothetical protein
LTPDTVISVLYAAEKYGVEDLVIEIKSYLDQNITHETVMTIFGSAKIFNLEDLVQKCKAFIESDPDPILQSASAMELSKETLEYVISLDSLTMDELDIYKFLIKWADSQCDRMGKEKTDQNIRTVMGDLIYNIRFHSMKVESFVKDVCNREILNAQEKLSLQQVIVGNQDKRNTKVRFGERKSKLFWIWRGEGVDKTPWTYSCNSPDCILFTVSKNVRIHGFVMWGGKSVPYTYTIQAKLFQNSEEVSIVPVQTVEKKEVEGNKFTITLPNPVLLTPGMRYTAWVLMEGPDSWRGKGYKSSVTEHDVNFQFYSHDIKQNGTSVSLGQFPGFICSL